MCSWRSGRFAAIRGWHSILLMAGIAFAAGHRPARSAIWPQRPVLFAAAVLASLPVGQAVSTKPACAQVGVPVPGYCFDEDGSRIPCGGGGGGGNDYVPQYVPRPVQPSPQEIARQRAYALNLEGVALSKRGNFEAALEKYRAALAHSPGDRIIHSNVLVLEAWFARQRGEHGLAVAKAREAHSLSNHPQVRAALRDALNAEGLALEGDLEGQLGKFKQALAIDPSNRVIKGNIASVEGDIQRRESGRLTDIARALQKERAALEKYKSALALQPANPTFAERVRASRQRLANLEGMSLFQERSWSRALEKFKSAEAMDPAPTFWGAPRDQGIRYNILSTEAQIALNAGDHRLARAKVDEALRYVDRPSASLQVLIDELRARELAHSTKTAPTAISGGLRRQPRPGNGEQAVPSAAPTAVNLLGDAQSRYARGDKQGAVEDLGNVVRLQPFNHVAARLLAELRAELAADQTVKRPPPPAKQSPGAQALSAGGHGEEAARLARAIAFEAAAMEARKQFDTGGDAKGTLQYPPVEGHPSLRGFASLPFEKQTAVMSTPRGQELVQNEMALQTKLGEQERKVQDLEAQLATATAGDRSKIEIDVVKTRTERDKTRQLHHDAQRKVEEEAIKYVLK